MSMGLCPTRASRAWEPRYNALCHQHTDVGRKIQDIIHKDIKKSGPRRLPCGTPQRKGRQSDTFHYILLVESGPIDMTESVL